MTLTLGLGFGSHRQRPEKWIHNKQRGAESEKQRPEKWRHDQQRGAESDKHW